MSAVGQIWSKTEPMCSGERDIVTRQRTFKLLNFCARPLVAHASEVRSHPFIISIETSYESMNNSLMNE